MPKVRDSGKFAFMQCRWGPDYADPQTWTEPFQPDAGYSAWDVSGDLEIRMHYEAWASKVSRASSIYDKPDDRYWFYAEAERLLIDHAIVIPYSIEGRNYIMSRLNLFEGEYAPYGIANQRYKGYILHDSSMGMEEFARAYASWQQLSEEKLRENALSGR